MFPNMEDMKDSFLPPIITSEAVTSDADDEESNSGDEDTYLYKRDEDFWSKRIPKCMNLNPNGNRTVANQSSLSDSFVLPTISDPFSPTLEQGDNQSYKKSRTAGGRLDHFSQGPKRSNGIPLSKSCPTLSRRKGNRRRANAADGSDEFSEETDFDRKAISYNVGSELRKELNNSATRGRKSKKKSKGKKNRDTQNHIYETEEHHNSTNDLILPSIFAAGASDQLEGELRNLPRTKHHSRGKSSKNQSGKSSFVSQSRHTDKPHQTEGHLPVMFEVDYSQSDRSIDMEFSPWDDRSSPHSNQDGDIG